MVVGEDLSLKTGLLNIREGTLSTHCPHRSIWSGQTTIFTLRPPSRHLSRHPRAFASTRWQISVVTVARVWTWKLPRALIFPRRGVSACLLCFNLSRLYFISFLITWRAREQSFTSGVPSRKMCVSVCANILEYFEMHWSLDNLEEQREIFKTLCKLQRYFRTFRTYISVGLIHLTFDIVFLTLTHPIMAGFKRYITNIVCLK